MCWIRIRMCCSVIVWHGIQKAVMYLCVRLPFKEAFGWVCGGYHGVVVLGVGM